MLGLNTNKARPKAKRKPFLVDDGEEQQQKQERQVRKGRRREDCEAAGKSKKPKAMGSENV